MSVLLFIVGAFVTMLGIGMAGYGIPINEFSFGNTLIIAGTTAAVGGLILIGLAATIGQLKRIAETLADRAPAHAAGSPDAFEPLPRTSPAPAHDRIPFPPKPKTAAERHEPQPVKVTPAPAEMLAEDRADASVAPMLPNPEIPAVAVTEYEAVSLSPQQPSIGRAPVDLGEPAPQVSEKHVEPSFEEASWRFPPPASPPERQAATNYFDSMWPAESKAAKRSFIDEPNPEPRFEEPHPELPAAVQAVEPPPVNAPPVKAPPVQILKSGVVDGMGYTLYIDGSIEAELPQGTLHFASINELRDHLAKHA